jgi:hypothetical protein
MTRMERPRLRADFNGVFGDLLCLSHSDSCQDKNDRTVALRQGMIVTVYEVDLNERGERDDLVASGTVEPAPDWLRPHGSRWVLRLDGIGIRHQSDLRESD